MSKVLIIMQQVYGGIFFLLIWSTITSSLEHDHRGALDSYHVSSGHFFQLSCDSCTEGCDSVNWTRGGGLGPGLPLGVEVRQGSLWFLPAQHDHSGLYTCKARNDNESWEIEFSVSVDPGPCPEPDEARSVIQGTNDNIPCKQNDILSLDSKAHIRWFKDCRPVDVSGAELRVPNVSAEVAGVYTCMVGFSLEGHNYNSSRSMTVSVTHAELLQKPKVTYPRQENIVVEPGSSLKLTCSAFVGSGEDVEVTSQGYWNIDGKHIDEFQQLRDSWDFVHEGANVYLQSTLNISEVGMDILGVPLKCVVSNPLGRDTGVVWLHPADHRFFYIGVSLPLVLPLGILVIVFGFLFKVDLVLVHRKLRPRVFRRKRTPDGKLFDAFVSYLHGDAMCSSRAMTFALQMLPEVLEKQHGYTLYIVGRDDPPGEAMHNVVAKAMERSRRLIMVLSGSSISSVEQNSLWQPDYEQRMGLHLALVHSSLRVILVEVDTQVDYSALPESLRYIQRKQGALRWNPTPAGSPPVPPSKRFWKCLRYHMPSEPGERTLGKV